MVVKFSKQQSNYTQQNIIDVLSVASMENPLIYNLMMSPYDYILVEGDVHRSQFTADNTWNNFWIKIKGFTSDGFPIPELKAAHIYLCFRNIVFDYRSRQFIIGGCINPPEKKGTDIADISQLRGTWEFVRITYGLSPRTYFRQQNQNRKPVKKSPSKALKIIDPKTGKQIKVGGAKQKGGSGEQTLDEFLAEGINRMRLDNNEVNDLISGIKKMKVITPKKVMSSFEKILAARGKAAQQRKQRKQNGGAKKKATKKAPKKKAAKKAAKKAKK